MKILLVDDQPQNNYILRVLFEGSGYTVIEAGNGAEALSAGRSHNPDLVISDLLMPVMDGFALLRHWMQDAKLKKVPFLVYTATYREPEDEMLALSLGARRYMLKPMEVEDLLNVVSDILNSARPDLTGADTKHSSEVTPSYQTYDENLIRRLEERAIELEKANSALKEEIEKIKNASSKGFKNQ